MDLLIFNITIFYAVVLQSHEKPFVKNEIFYLSYIYARTPAK